MGSKIDEKIQKVKKNTPEGERTNWEVFGKLEEFERKFFENKLSLKVQKR